MRLALVLPVALMSCVTTATKPPTTPVAPQALQLTLPRFGGGEPYTLLSDRGSVVLIDLWATWCEPCRDALPVYMDFAERLRPKGLKVYTINIDADDHAVASYVKELNLTLPVLRDPDAHFAESALKVQVMPTTVLIDKKGFVRFTHEGFSEELLTKYDQELELLLAESP